MMSMSADCCAPRRPRLTSVGLAYTPAALLALLLPKCPMCLAAWLGLGLVLPSQSYLLLIAASAVLGTLVLWRRRCASHRDGADAGRSHHDVDQA